MLYGDYLFSEISEIEAVDCEILFATTSWKIDKFFLSFSTLYSEFREHVKVYPNKTYM